MKETKEVKYAESSVVELIKDKFYHIIVGNNERFKAVGNIEDKILDMKDLNHIKRELIIHDTDKDEKYLLRWEVNGKECLNEKIIEI